MMFENEWLQIVLLSVIQGLTEFLPISSSAHLQLPRIFLGWNDHGLVFDLATHAGTLIAVIVYFRVLLWRLLYDGVASLGGTHTRYSRLGWLLILATLPVVVAGLLFESYISTVMRSPLIIAINTILFAFLLWYADKKSFRKNKISAKPQNQSSGQFDLTWQIALFIGCAQILALGPGVSRSGIVMTAALLIGMRRSEASEFAFLLAIPVIAGAALLKAIGIIDILDPKAIMKLLLGLILSAIVAFLCIRVFLSFVERIGFMPFVIYRIILGLIILIIIA